MSTNDSQLTLFEFTDVSIAVIPITCEKSYKESREKVQTAKRWLAKVDAHYGDLITDAKKVLTHLKEKHNETRHDVANMCDALIEAQKQYLTTKRQADHQILDRVKDELSAEKQQEIIRRAYRLAMKGKTTQAVELFTQGAALSVDVGSPQKLQDTMTTWTYRIVDVTKLNQSFVTLTPNKKMILALVRKHHKSAEDMVGEGSIEVMEVVSPRYSTKEIDDD